MCVTLPALLGGPSQQSLSRTLLQSYIFLVLVVMWSWRFRPPLPSLPPPPPPPTCLPPSRHWRNGRRDNNTLFSVWLNTEVARFTGSPHTPTHTQTHTQTRTRTHSASSHACTATRCVCSRRRGWWRPRRPSRTAVKKGRASPWAGRVGWK